MTAVTMTVERNGEELEVEVSGRVFIRPGRYSGPPEDCYPDESEVDSVLATLGGKPFELTDPEYDKAVDALFEAAQEEMAAAYYDGPEPDDYPDDVCDQFYSPY